jgi:hypothetical protein
MISFTIIHDPDYGSTKKRALIELEGIYPNKDKEKIRIIGELQKEHLIPSRIEDEIFTANSNYQDDWEIWLQGTETIDEICKKVYALERYLSKKYDEYEVIAKASKVFNKETK